MDVKISNENFSEEFVIPAVIEVEACISLRSTAAYGVVVVNVKNFLSSFVTTLRGIENMIISKPNFGSNDFLMQNVEFIQICEIHGGDVPNSISDLDVRVHVYQLGEEEATEEVNPEESVVTCTVQELPARSFHGLFDSLIFDDDIPKKLLQYVHTSMIFADNAVDNHIIAFNKVVLLHGPPGTGKTSLCRALAHKIAIRLSDRFTYGKLIEINSHSLFSKYFSESGKLVGKMFQQIHEAIEDDQAFVCVLIDEVESLSAARKAAMSGMEPSDAIRVVNALLTQIDGMKRKRNVLILTTSNIHEAIGKPSVIIYIGIL
ncbi:Pachytene checkpoint protein 2 [Nowakowskiella sp. JEL0407]|nr:Pachytene checkpoint protein 2 [Nowakowskiella sp. JEL0407]